MGRSQRGWRGAPGPGGPLFATTGRAAAERRAESNAGGRRPSPQENAAMLSFLSPLCRGRPRPFVLAFLLVAVTLGLERRVPAQRLGEDPVEPFKHALRTITPTPPLTGATDTEKEEYKKAIDKYKAELLEKAGKLVSPGQIASALLLQGWREETSLFREEQPLIDAQKEVRNVLFERFSDKMKKA